GTQVSHLLEHRLRGRQTQNPFFWPLTFSELFNFCVKLLHLSLGYIHREFCISRGVHYGKSLLLKRDCKSQFAETTAAGIKAIKTWWASKVPSAPLSLQCSAPLKRCRFSHSVQGRELRPMLILSSDAIPQTRGRILLSSGYRGSQIFGLWLR